MALAPHACLFPLVLAAALPLTGQARTDLTGKPLAVIAQPFSALGSLRDLGNGRVLVTDPVERHLGLAEDCAKQLERERTFDELDQS